MKARGRAGSVRVGGREAARLGTWLLDPESDSGHALVAQMEWRDAFWLERGPHVVRLRLATKDWVWRGVDVSTDGESLRAALDGEPEVEDCA